ncbi:SMC-Scp complex subunit ScpB [Olivibacter sitiensis]|uniref:SMC-Scp complex subunit ScpB n=1 Tax=Olivibacter sitiensis TaxID=376470 RepID=UPI00048666AC|nr:SMC-Scp complex subunit ScpB [Olivibacter sitiensis]
MENLEEYIEALIFASEQSLELYDIKQVVREALEYEMSNEEALQALDRIAQKYEQDYFAIQLVEINNGYQFLTKSKYHKIINYLQAHKAKKKLSQSALETLAIISYRQPITKLEIEHIRGVNCDYSIQKLLEKDLIAIIGKSESVGKPLLYGTSALLMDYFGIKSVADLPKLKDIVNESNTIGQNEDENAIPEP